MIENRKDYRLPFRTKIIFGNNERVSTGNATNISAGGVFVMTLEPFPSETRCQAIFVLDPEKSPLCVDAVVKRVVASSVNLEEMPGLGLNFVKMSEESVNQLATFMTDNRKNFELASTLLQSGEPDLASLEPLLDRMHLPHYSDFGELKFFVERILKSMEIVDRANSQNNRQVAE